MVLQERLQEGIPCMSFRPFILLEVFRTHVDQTLTRHGGHGDADRPNVLSCPFC